MESDERKLYIFGADRSIDGIVFVVHEVEKLVRFEDKDVVVVQSRHVASNTKWINIVGYVLEKTDYKGKTAYYVQPIIQDEELAKIKPVIEADESLEKKVRIVPFWSRYQRGGQNWELLK